VGDERAETYLRLLAEAELRRAADQLRALDAAAGTGGLPDPGRSPFRTAENASWTIGRAGWILVAAGLLDRDYLAEVATDLHLATQVRSQLLLNEERRRGTQYRFAFGVPGSPPSAGRAPPPRGARQAMRVTPVGLALPGAGDRAPWTLHLMSLMRTKTEAVISVAMCMHWPPDGSSADLELTGAGPHHMPYDQLGAVDDQGTPYQVRFEGGWGGTATWPGFARLSPVPPPDARWLDLVGDGDHLIRLPLGPPAPADRRAMPSAAGPVAAGLAERLLIMAAEHILATGDASGGAHGHAGGPSPGEIITVLQEASAIAADSPVPGQLAALCQRLGATGHGITVPPGEELPAPWASVIAHRGGPAPAGAPEVFAPIACVLPDVDGARFALAGLSTAAGESQLHVISSGMPRLTGQFEWDWTPGFSWWLRDSAGNWHVGTPGAPDTDGNDTFGDGVQAFWLRLTPPLAVPGPAEIVVTGPATQARTTVSWPD
jgi:hypothetical protein